MRSPPGSNDFAKFVGFVTLLSDPKELSKNIKQFDEAQGDYEVARKDYDNAVKIAATVEIAEALLVSNQEEAARLKVLDKSMYDREKAVDNLLAKKHQDFKKETRKTVAELTARESELNHTITSSNVALEAQEQNLSNRETALVDGLANFEKEKRIFENKKSRVEQAYEAA